MHNMIPFQNQIHFIFISFKQQPYTVASKTKGQNFKT